jgi:hypothetical protein
MPSISLTLPTASTLITAALHSGNYTALQNLLNSGLDGTNLKGGPALAAGEAPVWDGTNFARSSVTKLGANSLSGLTSVFAGTVSAANTDLAWAGGSATSAILAMGGTGGSVRSIAAPTAGDGTRLVVRVASGVQQTFLHNTAGGTGKKLYMNGSTSHVLGPGDEKIEFYYDLANDLWIEINRDQGQGQWQTYTPAWTASTTNPTLGNGTITGRYTQIGKTVHAMISVLLGSTTTVGSGSYSFSLPIAINAAVSGFIGWGRLVDVSAGAGYPAMSLVSTSTSVQLQPLDTAPTPNAFGAAVPVVPAVGDVYTANMAYEAA